MNTNDERTRFFEETYSQYHKKLENICLRYVDYDEEYRDLIDESIQETYLTAVAEYESLRKHTALEGWFVKTCYNRFTTAVSTYRRRKNCHAYSLDDEEKVPQVAQTISALDAWLARENMEAYTRRVLDTLNNREAEIFHERFEEDIKLSDIAKR